MLLKLISWLTVIYVFAGGFRLFMSIIYSIDKFINKLLKTNKWTHKDEDKLIKNFIFLMIDSICVFMLDTAYAILDFLF